MTKINDGGPAFPTLSGSSGMTLRDWFAGRALAGILANPNIENPAFAMDATVAYKAADAMIAARDAE